MSQIIGTRNHASLYPLMALGALGCVAYSCGPSQIRAIVQVPYKTYSLHLLKIEVAKDRALLNDSMSPEERSKLEKRIHDYEFDIMQTNYLLKQLKIAAIPVVGQIAVIYKCP